MRVGLGFVITLLLTLSLSACSDKRLVGNGEKAQQQRTVGSFSHINVSGHIVVNFKQSKQQSVVIETDSNIIPVVMTTVDKGDLLISMKPGIQYSIKNPITVNVSAPHLVKVSSSGSNIVNVLGLESPGLTVLFDGAGQGSFSGVVRQVNYNIIGTARINAKNLLSEEVRLSVVGAGEMRISVSSFLNVNISGVGQVIYYGDPQIQQKVYGLGKLIKGQS